MNYINVGALDKDTIFDQVELFVDNISEIYQGLPMEVCMSQYWAKKYLQDKRAQNYYQKTSQDQIDFGVDFTPLNVKGLAAMNGTNDIFCTPKQNLLHITPITQSKSSFKLEESKRSVAVLASWNEGLGFGINQAVWTNIAKNNTSASV